MKTRPAEKNNSEQTAHRTIDNYVSEGEENGIKNTLDWTKRQKYKAESLMQEAVRLWVLFLILK